MPRSAIMTGAVDLVLPVAEIPDSPRQIRRPIAVAGRNGAGRSIPRRVGWPRSSICCARRTSHDFALYKPGTLRRRIERRMALAGIDDSGRYLDASAAGTPASSSSSPRTC